MFQFNPGRRQIALVLLALLIVFSGCAGLGGESAGSSGAPERGGGGDSADLARSGGGGEGGSGGGGQVGSYYTDDGDRIVVRESNIDLRVNNFSHAFQRLRTIVDRNDGYLGDRSQSSQGDWDRGSITLRVPPERFASTRDAVASLGRVEDENVRVLDFTSQYNDREGRLQQLEMEEAELERLLNQTDDVDEAAQVRDDLREVRNDIRSLESEQQSLRERETMSTIRVDMQEPDSEKPPKNYESAFGFTDAFLEAFYGGMTAMKYVIVFFGYAIPIGLALIPLGAFGVGIVAGWRRTTSFVGRLLSRDGGDGQTVEADSGADRTDEKRSSTAEDGGEE